MILYNLINDITKGKLYTVEKRKQKLEKKKKIELCSY